MVAVDSQRTATAEAAGTFVEVHDDFEALWALRGGEGALAERLLAARHVAFIYGALDELTALALHSLVRDLAHDRHTVTLGLRAGNARGAEDVLTWQTGFAGPVDFARGFPREAERGEIDAALVVAADLPRPVEVPTVAIDSRATAPSRTARVAFATAADGIEVAGTAHRMDGVPVPLRAPRPSDRPSIEDVLAAIEERL
jgi:formylmethanofuran dehydrogenase subunit B